MSEDTGCVVVIVIILVGMLVIPWVVSQRNLQKQRHRGDKLRNNIKNLGNDPVGNLNHISDLGVVVPQKLFLSIIGDTHLMVELKRRLAVYLNDDPGRACLARFFFRFGHSVSSAEPSGCAAIVADIFYSEPDDWRSHEFALSILRSLTGMPGNISEWIYRTTLELLEKNPGSVACRRLGLEVGRWHFGRLREDGRPTTYDEQAIQNDLMVRAK